MKVELDEPKYKSIKPNIACTDNNLSSTLSLRITKGLKDELKLAARRNGRSLNDEVYYRLRVSLCMEDKVFMAMSIMQMQFEGLTNVVKRRKVKQDNLVD